MIADITGARGGVYFEAGFAKALGRDVFFTCRKDRFSQDKHFDTEHFHHTTWGNTCRSRKKPTREGHGAQRAGPTPIRAIGLADAIRANARRGDRFQNLLSPIPGTV